MTSIDWWTKFIKEDGKCKCKCNTDNKDGEMEKALEGRTSIKVDVPEIT